MNVLNAASGLVASDRGTAGAGDGWLGYGGAAGGSGIVPSGPYKGNNVGDGVGGQGGCSGQGGQPGTTGGSSVAILVIAGQLTVTRSVIRSGLGGSGGAGGVGGQGGHGTPGYAPLQDYQAGAPAPTSACTAPSDDVYQVGCAAYGGLGGEGGVGGRGGAGAGGWSIGVLTASGAGVTIDTTTKFSLGKPGVGGLGNGGGQAPSGRVAKTTTLDM
ncbi:MAG TPA: hypothetical protein VII82_00995 [Polyangiaceae bacterium]